MFSGESGGGGEGGGGGILALSFSSQTYELCVCKRKS